MNNWRTVDYFFLFLWQLLYWVPLLGSLYYVKKYKRGNPYLFLVVVVFLMLMSVGAFIVGHVVDTSVFEFYPPFVRIYYDEPLANQRENLFWYLSHGIVGFLLWSCWIFQFNDKWRAKYRRAHKMVGYVYIVGLVFFVLASFRLMSYSPKLGSANLVWKVFVVSAGSLTLLAAGLAVRAAILGKLQSHRLWMTRSAGIMSQTLFMRPFLFLFTLFTANVAELLTAAGVASIGVSIVVYWWILETDSTVPN